MSDEVMSLEQMAQDLQDIIDGERPRLNKTEMRDYIRSLQAAIESRKGGVSDAPPCPGWLKDPSHAWAAGWKMASEACAKHLEAEQAMQDLEPVPSNELPDGYSLGHRGNEWWPLHGRQYASSVAYSSKAAAVLAAWQHSHERLRSNMEIVREFVGRANVAIARKENSSN